MSAPEIEVSFREPAEEKDKTSGEARQVLSRQMNVSKADLDKYSYIVRCPHCRNFGECGVSKLGGVDRPA